MNPIPNVWNHIQGNDCAVRMHLEAANAFRQFSEIPCSTLEEWLAYREDLRNTIRKKLFLDYDRDLDVDYKEYGSIDCNGYSIRKITYASTPEMKVTANLFVPDGEGPFPAVVAVHGHWAQGKIAQRVQCRSHLLAKNGFVVIAVDAFGAGERGSTHGEFEYHGGMLGSLLFHAGQTLMGCQIRDNMRAVDLLCSLPFVDKNRIGVTGASGGGNQTMYLAAMDDRIKVSAPVVSVGTYEQYVHTRNCVCELLPDGLTFTEESAILALAAPNPMLIMNAMGDSNPSFFPKEMLRSFGNARKIYALYGKEFALDYKVFDTTHGYWEPMRESMIGFFKYHLKGEGHSLPEKECAYECLPEEDLMVFPKGEKEEKVLSIKEFCNMRGKTILEYVKNNPGTPDKQREFLAEILRVQDPLTVKRAAHPVKEGEWEKYTLTLSDGRQLPFVLRKGNDEYVLLTHPAGKAALTFPEDNGETFAAFDLSFQGENGSPGAGISPYHDPARQLLWLGKTLLGEWVRELGAVCAWLRKTFPGIRLTVCGEKETAQAVLYASVLYPDLADKLVLKNPVQDFLAVGEKPDEFYNMAFLVPCLLMTGDQHGLAKTFNSEIPVEWITPCRMDGSEVSPEK